LIPNSSMSKAAHHPNPQPMSHRTLRLTRTFVVAWAARALVYRQLNAAAWLSTHKLARSGPGLPGRGGVGAVGGGDGLLPPCGTRRFIAEFAGPAQGTDPGNRSCNSSPTVRAR